MSRQHLTPGLNFSALAFALLVFPIVAFATPIISGERSGEGLRSLYGDVEGFMQRQGRALQTVAQRFTINKF